MPSLHREETKWSRIAIRQEKVKLWLQWHTIDTKSFAWGGTAATRTWQKHYDSKHGAAASVLHDENEARTWQAGRGCRAWPDA